jgi:hypothetical protein
MLAVIIPYRNNIDKKLKPSSRKLDLSLIDYNALSTMLKVHYKKLKPSSRKLDLSLIDYNALSTMLKVHYKKLKNIILITILFNLT